MIKDRVQIDGVWYRREAEAQEEREPQLTFAQTCTYETDEYCWEAVRLQRDEAVEKGYYPGIDIKFTDKTEKPWTEEYWDNNVWMRGVLQDDPESMKEAVYNMNARGVQDFRAFLRRLVEIGWLTAE
jgi:hypothetical protein